MREARLWGQVRLLAALTVFLSLLAAGTVSATIKYGDFQLSGNFETMNSMRHASEQEYQFIGNRNTFRARVDWDWLKDGNFLNKFNVPFLESSKLFVLYRGVYDSFYDIAPHDRQHGQTRYDDLIGGRISDLSDDLRDAYKWDNSLREIYIDAKVKDLPLSIRAGRQQVIWGESDNFRLGDIWNPLDFSWHAQQDSWEQLRIPLWLIKGLWDFGQIGPLSNSFLEVVWNPGDYNPTKTQFLPKPWAVPYANPLRPGQISSSSSGLISSLYDLNGTSLRKGDFKRNPAEASEIGTRFHFVTPQGIELSANYLYGRGRGPIGVSGIGTRIKQVNVPVENLPAFGGVPVGTYQVDQNDPNSVQPVGRAIVDAKAVHPYTHMFGLNGNYFDGDFTQAVLRWEMLYVMGQPVTTTEAKYLPPVYATQGGVPIQFAGYGPQNMAKRDVWGGMIGWDRPTWIRLLNKKNTFFLSFQFFYQYIFGGHFDNLINSSGAGDKPYFGPMGQWVTGPYTGQVERQALSAPGIGNGDKMHQWESLITFVANTYYMGGTLQPQVVQAIDPVDSTGLSAWSAEYFVSNDLIVSLSQKFYYKFGSNMWPANDPWFAGGRFARRDETVLKVTYQY